MPDGEILAPEVWFAGLPGVVVAAGALITDRQDRVLLVKPNYRDHWSLPGGICEFGEPPQDGCAREVAEEVGLTPHIGRLLAIDWSQLYGVTERPIMHFVFDGGRVDGGGDIVLQESELDGFRFAARSELAEHLPVKSLARLSGALWARAERKFVFLPHQPGYQPAPG
jgi:ADP-ribose pyrophosphatase YjhB (NUDIX family)